MDYGSHLAFWGAWRAGGGVELLNASTGGTKSGSSTALHDRTPNASRAPTSSPTFPSWFPGFQINSHPFPHGATLRGTVSSWTPHASLRQDANGSGGASPYPLTVSPSPRLPFPWDVLDAGVRSTLTTKWPRSFAPLGIAGTAQRSIPTGGATLCGAVPGWTPHASLAGTRTARTEPRPTIAYGLPAGHPYSAWPIRSFLVFRYRALCGLGRIFTGSCSTISSP